MDAENLTLSAGAVFVLGKLTSKSLTELGEIVADRVRVWRFRNQVCILEEAAKYAQASRLGLRVLPLKTLLPLLEGASMEEDSMLRAMWARLLVNASATGAGTAICGVASDLLKSLSVSDAQILEALFVEVSHTQESSSSPAFGNYLGSPTVVMEGGGEGPFRLVSRARLLEMTGLPREEFEVCYDSVTRFNIIEAPQRHDLDGRNLDRDYYAFTRLGWRVMSLLTPQR